MSAVVNIAAYKFVTLQDAAELRAPLLERAQALALKGTVLLAPEGINLFLAGARAQIDAYLAYLRQDPRLADLQAKYSLSDEAPFKRLRVKLKREIIRMDRPAIRPQAGRAPSVPAQTLARWLAQGSDDAGRPLALLDTRNGFEVDAGTFEGAIDWRLERFTQFPAAFEAHRAQLEGKTVVSFCTGGIRCEKAALYMRAAGLEQVYQLEGGILKYFEETGGPGYRGGCFVFDERQTLDPSLAPRPL
ncbi:sulfurtransferase [Orrella sp. JC864]|uniref:sulfurtransferase n=1 Tax=Orrella sp. JC864 TaxID=3120298 RepID=UPI00142C0081